MIFTLLAVSFLDSIFSVTIFESDEGYKVPSGLFSVQWMKRSRLHHGYRKPYITLKVIDLTAIQKVNLFCNAILFTFIKLFKLTKFYEKGMIQIFPQV